MGLDPRSTAQEHATVVVGRGDRFEGLLTFRGDARVDGELRGAILAEGRLEIGAPAHVEARIEADELVIAGLVEGDLSARQRIEVLAGARVRGELRAPRIALQDGCQVEGRCEMTSPGPSEPDLFGKSRESP